jgi:hypothetical protein
MRAAVSRPFIANALACEDAAIRGGMVCMSHDATSPQVRQAAGRRLAFLVDPAYALV